MTQIGGASYHGAILKKIENQNETNIPPVSLDTPQDSYEFSQKEQNSEGKKGLMKWIAGGIAATGLVVGGLMLKGRFFPKKAANVAIGNINAQGPSFFQKVDNGITNAFISTGKNIGNAFKSVVSSFKKGEENVKGWFKKPKIKKADSEKAEMVGDFFKNAEKKPLTLREKTGNLWKKIKNPFAKRPSKLEETLANSFKQDFLANQRRIKELAKQKPNGYKEQIKKLQEENKLIKQNLSGSVDLKSGKKAGKKADRKTAKEDAKAKAVRNVRKEFEERLARLRP